MGIPISCISYLAGVFPPLASQGSGQTLLEAMAHAVGARMGASPELLGHFVRAGGGDVGKAASLYLAMADEFVELRAMARCVYVAALTCELRLIWGARLDNAWGEFWLVAVGLHCYWRVWGILGGVVPTRQERRAGQQVLVRIAIPVQQMVCRLWE